MDKYNQTIAEITRAMLNGRKLIIDKDGNEGFEIKHGTCDGCEYHVILHNYGGPACVLKPENQYFRQVRGGAVHGGRCYEFVSLDALWTEFSSQYAVDPETGEVFLL